MDAAATLVAPLPKACAPVPSTASWRDARCVLAPNPLRVAMRFAVVLAVLGWFGLRRVVGALTGSLDGPAALRRAFERLGPVYVKLGQLVASGEALFPARYSEAMRTLLDRVAPIPLRDVRAVITAELGAGARAVLPTLEQTPLAAASIAQVHGARLADGREVVVKVQRPGVAALAASDLVILRLLARIATRLSGHARRANLVAFVDDFATHLVAELDFTNEARRMRDFSAVMRKMGNEDVVAPEVVASLTGARVLTMERFRGWRIDEVAAVRASAFDPEERLLAGIRAWFQTLIVGGFFHGDVHAGNFMLLEDGRVGFLDFGIVGTFDAQQRAGVLGYVVGFQQRDFERVAGSMIALGAAHGRSVEPAALGRDLESVFSPALDSDEGFGMRDLVPGIIRCAATHGLRMPRDLVLVTKQLVYLDRYSRAYGGTKMNVLTDVRLSGLILTDLARAMAWGEAAGFTKPDPALTGASPHLYSRGLRAASAFALRP